MPVHLLLDWSGTLCDDISTTLRATNAVLRGLGGREASLEEYREEFRLPAFPFYRARIPAATSCDPDGIEELFAEAMSREGVPRLFDGAAVFVRRAVEAGGTARIVSSLPQRELERSVSDAGLTPLLTGIHGAVRDKVAFVLDLVARERLDPDDCLFLGDLAHDLAAARGARIRACAILHGYGTESELRSQRPDEVWRDLHEADAWLKRHLALESRSWPISTVGGLVFREDGRAFYVRTAKWSGLWGTPGGKIDYGEGFLEAFAREIREETGLEIEQQRLVLVQDAIEEPEFHRPRHFVLLNLVGKVVGGTERLNHESLEGGWFTLDEASNLALNRPTRVLVDALRESGVGSWSSPPT